jgi:hypothetical protein
MDPVFVFTEILKIGDYRVHPRHIVFREHETYVHNKDAISIFDRHYIEADFSQSS